VKYDVAKMNWIGRINDLNRVFYVWHTVAAKSILDLRSKPLVVGSTGRSSETFINPAIMNELLGTKMKIVMGYKGAAAVLLAVEAGETEGASASLENIKNNHSAWLKDGKIRILVQFGLEKDSALPEVPLLQEFAGNDSDRKLIEFMSSSSQVGNGLVAGPGVSTPMVEALRTAFAKTMKDPEYLDLARKRNIVVKHLSGPELTELIGKTVNTAPDVVKRYKEVVGAQ
jgi:tripartite-type tricarboxylate transporter receptor subunit TctC